MPVGEVHPGAEELTAFILGTLGGEAHDSIAAHVAVCTACQERAAVAPGDGVVELLRRAHAHPGGQADTVAEAAQAQTPAPVATTEALTLSPAGRPEADSAEDAVPPELAGHPRYRVVRLLGQGGMGAVYEAEHRVMRRPVALKVIGRAFTANANLVERFRREVRAAALLSHPHIVTTYDAEDAGQTQFLAMEYVPGITLARLVKDRGPLPAAEACAYVRQAALGLQHAHERGMVHRDVKPDNLILMADPASPTPGVVKVLDFGLAALTAERASGLTDANAIMGTPEYMAPEQAEDAGRTDIRADVYSLGCTIYFLLTGQVPYPAATPLLKILAHRDRPLPSLAQACPTSPPGLDAVLARMLAKKPADRYQTPGEVAAALEPFLGDRPKEAARRGSKFGRLAAAALLLMGLVVAGVAVYRVQTDTGELVITTESDEVEVVVKQGGKEVRVIDTKTAREIKLTLRSGTYDLELKGAPEGLKLSLDKATLTRGDTVLAKIEKVGRPPKPTPGPEPGARKPAVADLPGKVGLLCVLPNATRKGDSHPEISPDGRLVALPVDGQHPGHVSAYRVYEVATGKLLREVKFPVEHATDAAFSADGRRLVVATAGYGVGTGFGFRRIDLETGENRFLDHVPRVAGWPCFLHLSPDGKLLAYSTGDGTAVVDLGSGKVLASASHGVDERRGVHAAYARIAPDGKRAYTTLIWGEPGKTTYTRGRLRIDDLEGVLPTKVADLGGPLYYPFVDVVTGWPGGVRDDGTGKTGNVVEFRDAISGQPAGKVTLPTTGVLPAIGGRRALGRTPEGKCGVYDLPSGKEVHALDFIEPLRHWAVSDDGRVVALENADEVRLYRLPNPAKENP